MNQAIPYSIGIVTYLGRFTEYFIPLINRLVKMFPDIDIIVFINGHYDQVKQTEYLIQITSLLQHYPNIRYLTNLEHQSLSKGWNYLVLMSQTDRILILNDDIAFSGSFRKQLESSLASTAGFFALNESFSHFVIDKATIKKVGWFDERFLGVGNEDGDYMLRMSLAGVPVKSVRISSLHNYVAKQKNPGWGNFSKVSEGKYTAVNREFMIKKWSFKQFGAKKKDYDAHVLWNNILLEASLNKGMTTPVFHEYSLLDFKPHQNMKIRFQPKNRNIKYRFKNFILQFLIKAKNILLSWSP